MNKQSLSFPTVAQIRLGAPKREQNGRSIVGQDLKEEFRIVFTPGFERHEAVFCKTYPNAKKIQAGQYILREIHAFLPFPSILDSWRWTLEAHSAGCMLAQADGERYISYRDPENLTRYLVMGGEPYRAYERGDVYTYTSRNGKQMKIPVKPQGRLSLVLHEMAQAGSFVSFELKTTGWYYCQAIDQGLASIATVAAMLNKFQIAGIPFYITRSPKEVVYNDPANGPTRVKKYVPVIFADSAWSANAVKRMTSLALGEGSSIAPMLQPPADYNPANDDIENEEIQEAIQGELLDDDERPEFVEAAQQPQQPQPAASSLDAESAPSSLEEAEAVCNSRGIRYGTLETKALTAMLASMLQDAEQYPNKIAATRMILEARKSGRNVQK